MNIIINFLVALIAGLHAYFLVLEMFLWNKPIGLKIFRQTLEQANASAVLAANQGLYNGFLTAGLVWSLLHPQTLFSHQLKVFFLVCVVIAGSYGGFSVSKRIFFIQAMPALITLVLLISIHSNV